MLSKLVKLVIQRLIKVLPLQTETNTPNASQNKLKPKGTQTVNYTGGREMDKNDKPLVLSAERSLSAQALSVSRYKSFKG